MANAPDRHTAGLTGREGSPGDAPTPDGDWGWLRRAVGTFSPSLAGQPPGHDEGVASHPIAFSDTSSMGSRVGSMSNISVASMATPEPFPAKQTSGVAGHPIAFSDTSSMGSRAGSMSNMSVASMATPEPSPAKQASSTPVSGDQPQVVTAPAMHDKPGRSPGPVSEAATAGTAVQRQEQMQSAPRLPPSPETAGKHDGSMSPAAKSPFGDFSEPASTAFERSSGAKADELAKDAGTSRRSLEGPAAMPGFARVDSRASPQKAGGPAGSSLGTEVSLKHGLGSGDMPAQAAPGASQLDRMPSLASGMGQRGSLDMDPAVAERYRQSQLQAAAAPIPEESTDLTFSSGMQLKAGQEAAWVSSGEGESAQDKDVAGRSQSGGAPFNHLRMPGRLAPLVIPARKPEQEGLPAKQEPPPPTAYPHDAGWASHLAGKEPTMPGTAAAKPATLPSCSPGSSPSSTPVGSPAVLQRDTAHQPSPKTDALVDQLLTGVVGNQLKEAPDSSSTQGLETSNMAEGSTRVAYRSQAALPLPSVRGRPTGPVAAGASRLAAEGRQQGPQEGTDSRSSRSGLAPTPTPTPSRASSAESGSVVGSGALVGTAEGGAPDVDPQELSHALEQAAESSSSAAAAAGRKTGNQVSAQLRSPVSSQASAKTAGNGPAVAGGSLGAGDLPRIQTIPRSKQPEPSSLAQPTAATQGSPAASGSARSAVSGSAGPRSPRPPRSPSSAHSTPKSYQSPRSPFQAASAFATGLASSAGGAVLSAWDAVMPPRSPVSSPRAAPAASMSGKAAIQSADSDASTSSTAASQFRPNRGSGSRSAAASAGGVTAQPRGTSQDGPALAGRGAEQLRGGLQGGSGEVMPGQSWEEYAAGLNSAGADEEPAAGHTRPAASAGRRGADLAAAPLQAGSSAEQGWATAIPAAGGAAAARRSLPSVLGKQDRAVPLAAQGSAAERSQASTLAVGASEERPSKRQHMGEPAAEAGQGRWPLQAGGAAAAQQEGSAEGSPAAVSGARHSAPASRAAAAQQEGSAESLSAPARGRSSAGSSGSQPPSRSSLIKQAVAEVNSHSASPTGSPRAFLPRGSSRGSPRVGAVSTGQGQTEPACQPQAEELAPATAEGVAGCPPAAVNLGQVQAGQAGEFQAEGQAQPQGLPAAARNSQAAEPLPGRASTVSGQREPAGEQQLPVGAAPSGVASARGMHTAASIASKEPAAAAAGLEGAGAKGTDGPAVPSTSTGREDASAGILQPAAPNVEASQVSQQQLVSEGTADTAGANRGQAASLPGAEGSTPAGDSGVDSEQGGLAAHDLPRSFNSYPQQEVTSGAGSAPAGQAQAAVSPGATTAATTAGTPSTGRGSTLRLGRLVMNDQPSSHSAGAVPASNASLKTQDRLDTGVGPSAVPAAAAEEAEQDSRTHSQEPGGVARADRGAASSVDGPDGRGSQEDSEAVLQRGTGPAGAAAIAAGAGKASQDQKTPAKQESKSPLSPLSLDTSPEYTPTDRTPEQGSPADSPRAHRASEAAGGQQGQQQGTQGSAKDSAAQQGAEEGARLGASTAEAQLPPVERPGPAASEPQGLQPGRQAAVVEASSGAAGAASRGPQGSALAGSRSPAGGVVGLSPAGRQAGQGTAAPRPAAGLASGSPGAPGMGAHAGSQGQAVPSKTASGAQGTASDPDAGSHPYRGSDAEAVAGSAGPWERSSPHQPVVPEELSSTAVGKVFGQGEPLAQPLLAKSESGRVTLSPEVAEAAAGRDPQKGSSVLNAAWASASAADREGAPPGGPPAASGLAAGASGAQRPPVAESPSAGATSRLGRRPGSEELPLPSAVAGQARGPESPSGAPAANRAPAERLPSGRTAAGGAALPPGAVVEPAARKQGDQALPYGLQKSGDERPAKPADTADPSEAYASSRSQKWRAHDAALKPEPEGLDRAAQLPGQAERTDRQVAFQQSRRAPTGTSNAPLASDAAAGSGLFSAAAGTMTSSSPEAVPARGGAATGSSEPAQEAPGESDLEDGAGMPATGRAESLTAGRPKAATTAAPTGSTPAGAGAGASLQAASKSDRDANTAGLEQGAPGGSGGPTASPCLAAAGQEANASEAVSPGGPQAQQGLQQTPDAAPPAAVAQTAGQEDAAAAGQGPQAAGQRAADTVSYGGNQPPRAQSLQLDLPPPFELDLEHPALQHQEAYTGQELGLTQQQAMGADVPESVPAEAAAAGQADRGALSPRRVGARARRGSPRTPQRSPPSVNDWEAATEHGGGTPGQLGAGSGEQAATQHALPGSAVPEEIPVREAAGSKPPAVAHPHALGGGGSPASPQHWRAWAPQEGSVSSPGGAAAAAGTSGPVGSAGVTAGQESRESTTAAPARFTGSSSGTSGQASMEAAAAAGLAGRAAGTAGTEGRASAAAGPPPGQEGRTSAAGASAPGLPASSSQQLTETAPRETGKGAHRDGGASTPPPLPCIPAAAFVRAAESPLTEGAALGTVAAAARRPPAPGTASGGEQLPLWGPDLAAKDAPAGVGIGADSAVEHASVKGASSAQEQQPVTDAGPAAECSHLSLPEQMAELEEMVLASAAACRPMAGRGSPGADRHSQSGLAVQQAMMTLRAVAAGRPEEATQTANDLPALAKEQHASPKEGSSQAAVVDRLEEVRLALLEAANQRSLYRPLVLRTTSRAVAVLLAVAQGQRLLVKEADEPSSSPKTGSSAPSEAGEMAASPLAVQSNSEDMSPAGWQKQGQAPHARPSQAAGLDAEAAGGQQELGQPAAHQASPGSPARLDAGKDAAAEDQLSRAPQEPAAGPGISSLEVEAPTSREAKPEAAIVLGKPGQLALPVGTRRAASADKEQAMAPSAVRLAAGRAGTGTARTGTAQGGPDGLSMGAANPAVSGKAGPAATSGQAAAGQQPAAPAQERAALSQSAGSVNGRQSSFNDALYGSHPSATGMQPPTLQHDVGDTSEESGKTRFTCCGFGGGKKRTASHQQSPSGD